MSREGGEGLASPSLERKGQSASPASPSEPQFGATNAFSGLSNTPRPGRREQRRPGPGSCPGSEHGCPASHPVTWPRPRRPRPPAAPPRPSILAAAGLGITVPRAAGAGGRGRRASEACSARPPRAPRRRERRGRRRGQQAGCGLGSGAALGVLQGAKINPAKDQVSRPK